MDLKIGDFVSFDYSCNCIYKILDITNKYILVSDGISTYWERIEYICCIIGLSFCKVYTDD